MQPGKLNIVTDSQFGSTGKGAITASLANKYKPDILSTTNMANAGHTAVWSDGSKFVAKALPSATMLTKWVEEYYPTVFIGASSAFDMKQLFKEIEETEIQHLLIHPRAGVITDKHKTLESDSKSGTKHLASTMQGCGAFLADKIMRRKDIKLARDYPELQNYIHDGHKSLPEYLTGILRSGSCILHEGSQGFSLDINHGHSYPYCTSRGTTAIQNMADLGLPPSYLGDIYLVLRPYPIRVGNVVENGEVVGYSGNCYSDQHEISWDDVAKQSGMPEDHANKLRELERTTVTKRVRRVYTFSGQQLREAALVNGATKLALNFANYIDWSCYGMSVYDDLPEKVINFIHKIEDEVGLPVAVVGTGPQVDHVCYL